MKRFENILGTILTTIIVGFIIFSIGYTIFTEGIFKVGSQNRYYDYLDY